MPRLIVPQPPVGAMLSAEWFERLRDEWAIYTHYMRGTHGNSGTPSTRLGLYPTPGSKASVLAFEPFAYCSRGEPHGWAAARPRSKGIHWASPKRTRPRPRDDWNLSRRHPKLDPGMPPLLTGPTLTAALRGRTRVFAGHPGSA